MRVTIEQYNGIYVLRDDLLPGGTKCSIMHNIIHEEVNEYVYASPVYGGFQIALSNYCQKHGKKATIFCAKRAKPHENTIKCLELGANVIQVPHGYLSVVEKAANIYCRETGATKIQFGAKTPENIQILSLRVKQVIQQLGFEPDEIFCAVGSGMLVESILKGTETAKVTGVCVGAEYSNGHERLRLMRYHKPFEKKSECFSPFPSMPNYDLKAYEYCARFHPPFKKTLFWNVL